LAGFEERKQEFADLGVSIVAASIDPIEKAKEVADELSFPIGYEVPRSVADALGSWWEDRRGLIQPSEFIVRPDNSVICSSYSDGPIGRFDAQSVLGVVKFNDAQAAKK
jgi:peroxiredoxin